MLDITSFKADRNPAVHSINARINHDSVITISCGANDAYVGMNDPWKLARIHEHDNYS